jgi:hypothetical protein
MLNRPCSKQWHAMGVRGPPIGLGVSATAAPPACLAISAIQQAALTIHQRCRKAFA